MALIDQYKQIQDTLTAKKAAGQNLVTNKENLDKAVAQFGKEAVNGALGQVQKAGVGITNTPAPVVPPIVPPVTTPEQPATTPEQTTTTTTPPTTPPTDTKVTTPPIPKGFEYGNVIDSKTGLPTLVKSSDFQRQNKLEINKSVYGNGKSIYDAVQSGSLLPGSKDFSDLQTVNPQAFQEYQTIKQDADKKQAINSLGNTILGQETPVRQTTSLQSLLNNISSSYDEDISSTYQKSINANPEYLAQVEKSNALNTQLTDINNNLRQIGEDVRKKYSAGTPESLIASAIARDSRPLIEQAQYLQDQLTNANAEATRIMDNNKEFFNLQMQDRNDKRNLAFQLYNTINADEIRQEDIIRADKKLADEIARTDAKDTASLKKLEEARADNVKIALAQLGVAPEGDTYDELLTQYATAVKNQPKATEKPFAVGKDSFIFDPETKTWITPPQQGGQGMDFSADSVVSYSTQKRGTNLLQCGELVNDYWQQATGSTAGLGNTFDSKLQAIQKVGQSNAPVVGGLFAFPVKTFAGNTGHTGIVKSVNPDGSITVLEANREENSKNGGTPKYGTYTPEQVKNMVFSQSPGTKYNDITDIELPEKTSEFKSKSYNFGVRLDESNKTLANVDKKFLDSNAFSEYTTLRGDYVPNLLKSTDQQLYEQAQRNFINAKLREESGAVISPQEFDNAKQQYFPQPGDSKEVIAQKAKNREQVIFGMFSSAGNTAKGEPIKNVYQGIVNSRIQSAQDTTTAPTTEYKGVTLPGSTKVTTGGYKGYTLPNQ